MTDEAKQSQKRTYVVLKKMRPATPENGTPWSELGQYTVGSERAAIQKAIDSEPESARGGEYVAIARFNPRAVAVKPVTQTKLEWS